MPNKTNMDNTELENYLSIVQYKTTVLDTTLNQYTSLY